MAIVKKAKMHSYKVQETMQYCITNEKFNFAFHCPVSNNEQYNIVLQTLFKYDVLIMFVETIRIVLIEIKFLPNAFFIVITVPFSFSVT